MCRAGGAWYDTSVEVVFWQVDLFQLSRSDILDWRTQRFGKAFLSEFFGSARYDEYSRPVAFDYAVDPAQFDHSGASAPARS